MKRFLLPFFLLFALAPQAAYGCSCEQKSIPARFDSSKNVLLVQVTSARLSSTPLLDWRDENIGLRDSDLKDGFLNRSRAKYQIIDSFKHEAPFKTINMYWSMCTTSNILVGGIYLLFTDDGNVHYNCESIREIDLSNADHIDTLKQLDSLTQGDV